jgi:hypothetical protein
VGRDAGAITTGGQVSRVRNARRVGGRVLNLEDVFRAIRRRWRLVAGVFLLACIGVGIFIYSRESNKPVVRYRSVATIQVVAGAAKPDKQSNSNRKTTTSEAIVANKTSESKVALSAAVKASALRGAKLDPKTRGIGWGFKLMPDGRHVTLTATAPTKAVASSVARGWANAFKKARTDSSRTAITVAQKRQAKKFDLLRNRLLTVDAKLAKLLPGIYGGTARLDRNFAGEGAGARGGTTSGTPDVLPPIPDSASRYVVNLAFERPQLLSSITKLATTNPDIPTAAFTSIIGQTPATRITKTRPTTIPAAGGLLAGLAIGIGAAVLIDRRDRRIRDPRTAAAAFDAPVLSLLPSSSEGNYVILSDPMSNTAEAYRGLAATSIATDRLPKAIMVSTPHGDAHEEVAANYAAALSRFGLKVALIATSPDQAWYADRFESQVHASSDEGDGIHAGSTFPELLVAAHAGTLNGQLRDLLPSDDRAPNLMVVPPSHVAPAQLPVDGLPPLLQALTDAGIDITVVSGPALLEEADATIVAWATRCVLWAIVEGEITTTEARAAAARLELAGVVPFGVVMIAHRPNAL